MSPLVIRPSTRIVKLTYGVAAALAAALAGWGSTASAPDYWKYLLAIPALLLLRAGLKHAARSFTSITITGDKLRYDSGVLSKDTRTIPLAKVQDVRVTRSLGQRMWGVGNISILTAAESGSVAMSGVDDPQVLAERILELSSRQQPAA